MSGTNTGRAARSDAEWVRDITRRVRSLENPATLRVGPWVLFERAGDLMAAQPDGQMINLSVPVAAEADTPAVTKQILIEAAGGLTATEVQAMIDGSQTSIFDELYQILAGFIPATAALQNLSGLLKTELARAQQLADAIYEGIVGLTQTGTLMQDIIAALQRIPFLNILGIGGPTNIGASTQAGWDNLISGLVGQMGTGAGITDLFNVSKIVSGNANLGRLGWDILGIRTNKSLDTGLLPTSDSTIKLPWAGVTAPTFPVTASTAITGWKRFAEAMPLGVISWPGQGNSNITDARLNVWKMDPATGDKTRVHASNNIIGDIAAGLAWNTYRIPTPIAVLPSDVYGAELEIRAGSGSHSIVGDQTWLPLHPTVFPRKLSSVRNPGGAAPPPSIPSAAVTYASAVPFFEFAIDTGLGGDVHQPLSQLFTASSTTPIPSWANFLDIIIVGGGGGGRLGGTLFIEGEGGGPGVWVDATWVRGVHFGPTDFVVSFTVGVGGGGGTLSHATGFVGSASSASIAGGPSVSAAGGSGGNALLGAGSGHNGESPGDHTYNGVLYAGGLETTNYGTQGNEPGGGGSGGDWLTVSSGGAGGKGRVWIVARQT